MPAVKRARGPRRERRPPRPPLPGVEATAFDLSRAHHLARIVASDVAPALHAEALVELAWDGHRVLACAASDAVRVVSSDLHNWADAFPTVVAAVRRMKRRDVVVEGFLCALGDGSLPTFELLRRHTQGKPQRIVFACVDLQRLDGEDLRALPLRERRERLAELVADDGTFAFSEALPGPLASVLDGVRRIGGRGVLVRALTETKAEWTAISCTDEPIAIDRSLSAPPRETNRDKPMYPRDGLAKRDVIAYYDEVAPIMLPYMRDRPVVGQRWPDGIDDFTWYQHRVPPRAPDYVRAVSIEGNRRIVVESRDALAWLANQAVLTFHAWASRCASLAEPDWVVIDLDPGESTTWRDVVDVAVALRKLLELLDVASVPKTSGQRGLHVLIPIAPGQTAQAANELARRLAKLLCAALPERATTELSIPARRGRLFLDTLQGHVGKTLVLPYSLRAVDGAPVSTPLDWSEVGPGLDPRVLSLRTMRRRLDTRGDLASPLLRGALVIADVLAKLDA